MIAWTDENEALRHLNRELDTDFRIDAFALEACWNDRCSRTCSCCNPGACSDRGERMDTDGGALARQWKPERRHQPKAPPAIRHPPLLFAIRQLFAQDHRQHRAAGSDQEDSGSLGKASARAACAMAGMIDRPEKATECRVKTLPDARARASAQRGFGGHALTERAG